VGLLAIHRMSVHDPQRTLGRIISLGRLLQFLPVSEQSGTVRTLVDAFPSEGAMRRREFMTLLGAAVVANASRLVGATI